MPETRPIKLRKSLQVDDSISVLNTQFPTLSGFNDLVRFRNDKDLLKVEYNTSPDRDFATFRSTTPFGDLQVIVDDTADVGTAVIKVTGGAILTIGGVEVSFANSQRIPGTTLARPAGPPPAFILHYIAAGASGLLTDNTTGFQGTDIPLATVKVENSSTPILEIVDKRSWRFLNAGGASGTFTTADAKTVTVTNGLITSIV